MALSTLHKRILSAVILAPCAIYMLVAGGWVMAIGLTLISCITIYEWFNLTRKINPFLPLFFIGTSYMLVALFSFIAIREVYSLNLLLIYLGMIWMSDIGAYFTGKFLGGPKLAQKISPNKTWSGFIGAMLSPAIFTILWVSVFGLYAEFDVWPAYILYPLTFVIGMVIGAMGQAGDLAISFAKRTANVKDTGNIIPGHGGLLDRVDSMLIATPVYLVIITLMGHIPT